MVSVVIINFNTFQITCGCIESVIKFTKDCRYEIILVDNASAECDPVLFQKKFPGIRLVQSTENTGFAGGNNAGIAHAAGDIILLLNSDTVLTEDAISKTAAYLQLHPDIGVIGCKMTYPDGRLQHTARRFRSVSWELLDLFRFLLLLFPYKARARRMLGRYFKSDLDATCDWLNGAFFMFRKNLLNDMAGAKLDDRFFMYGEDQLWCWQISKMGFTSFFFSKTSIIHINSGSTEKKKQLKLRSVMMSRELALMRERKGRGAYYILFKLIYLPKEKMRNLIKLIWYKLSGKVMR